MSLRFHLDALNKMRNSIDDKNIHELQRKSSLVFSALLYRNWKRPFQNRCLFLFPFRTLINRAWRFLPVLTAESEELSLVRGGYVLIKDCFKRHLWSLNNIIFCFFQSRLAIFRMSRNVLSTCLSIIGAKPLTKL